METTSTAPTTAAFDPATFALRYVGLWNEPDPDRRRAIVRDLWAVDGEHVADPPPDLKARIDAAGFAPLRLECRGHAEIETRAARTYENLVAPGIHTFRARGNAVRLRDLVTCNWEMVEVATGTVVAIGLDVFLLDADDRITVDHQIIER